MSELEHQAIGSVYRLQITTYGPLLHTICVEREYEHAKACARQEASLPYWIGSPQLLFVHRKSGFIELWNHKDLFPELHPTS